MKRQRGVKATLALALFGLAGGWAASAVTVSGCCHCDDVYLSVEEDEYDVLEGSHAALVGGEAEVTEHDIILTYEADGHTYRAVYRTDGAPDAGM